MSEHTKNKLPSGIVEFTITRKEMKDILNEKYNANVEKFSVEDDGISIKLSVPEENKNDFEKESEEEKSEKGSPML